jgi:hypothetical protein
MTAMIEMILVPSSPNASRLASERPHPYIAIIRKIRDYGTDAEAVVSSCVGKCLSAVPT